MNFIRNFVGGTRNFIAAARGNPGGFWLLVGVAMVILLVSGGWIANIVKLIFSLDNGFTAWMVVRTVAIFFFPLGVILGYF